MVDYAVTETDVLIVGGGGAGTRAAIAADEEGARVALVLKGQVAHSGITAMACPSYQAALAMEEPEDHPDIAFADTAREGRYLGDENLIRVLVEEATLRALEMERYGVKLTKTPEGRIFQVVHPGQSFARNLVIRGCGYGMMVGLRKELRRHKSVQLYEDYMIPRLLLERGRMAGAVALNLRDGSFRVFRAKTVILATGGFEELWEFTDTEPGATGEGVALGYYAGADLVDLEMMLFYPTCLVWPEEVEGTLVQYEGLLGPRYLAGRMRNGRGQEFLPPVKERYALPVRDIMMKAMFTEIDQGRGTPHGGLYIDLTQSPHSAKEIYALLHKLDSLPYNALRDLGVDVSKEPIEVKPGIHYGLGGVRIDERAETTVPGLYAAGEVSGNIHGANRTSGNALAETQVFGARAGHFGAQYALGLGLPPLDRGAVEEEIRRTRNFLQEKPHPLRPLELKRRLQRTMEEHLGHLRHESGMREALATVRRLRAEELPRVRAGTCARYTYEWQEALEVAAMLDLAELVIVSALERKESRGHHWRADFPEPQEDWLKHTIVRQGASGEPIFSTAPVVRLRERVLR